MDDDGIWLSGPRDVEPEETDRVLLTQFDQRRNLLLKFLFYLILERGKKFRRTIFRLNLFNV